MHCSVFGFQLQEIVQSHYTFQNQYEAQYPDGIDMFMLKNQFQAGVWLQKHLYEDTVTNKILAKHASI